VAERSWWQAGAWLAVFQNESPHAELPARQSSREDVVERFIAYDRFLHDCLGRAAGDGARRAAALAADVLPERLPLVVGHGDYAPRNAFQRPDGRLVVFDPLPRWAVPRLEDLARFLVAIRLLGVQLHTRGVAYAEHELAGLEHNVLDGYRTEAKIGTAELRCYQALISLDRWSALVGDPASGWRGRLHRASARLASGYLRAEVDRLLRLAGSASG
jgi:hypothetical protein